MIDSTALGRVYRTIMILIMVVFLFAWFYWLFGFMTVTPSPLFPEGRWLLCRPTYFDVSYEINPWMSIKRRPSQERAREQWKKLHHTLLRLGAWIEYVEPHEDWPDMVFTANAGLVQGKVAVLSRFKFKERQGEAPLFKEWFQRNGFLVKELTSGDFEGEGDALFAGKKLFLGYGFRTDLSIVDELKGLLSVDEVVPCKLTDGKFYHLDTCFCPLSPTLAFVHTKAISADSLREMERHIEVIPIPEKDGESFACNAVVLGKKVVIPSGCHEIRSILEKRGFEVFDVELDEFMKAGGSAKCLSLKLEQR